MILSCMSLQWVTNKDLVAECKGEESKKCPRSLYHADKENGETFEKKANYDSMSGMFI